MVVKPPLPKHKTEDFGDKLIITMPSRKVWPFILVFCIWSLFWLTMESTLGATIFTSHNPNPFNVITFIIFFAIWNLLGLFLVYNILWQLIVKEELQITKQSIKISQIVLMYKRSREYLFEHIKDLDLARVSISDLSFQRGQFPTGTKLGSISFDYGAQTFKFAGSIEEAEAKQIIAEIQQKYPQYKKQIS